MTISRLFLILSTLAVLLLLPAAGDSSDTPKKPKLVELMSPGCPACAEMSKVLDQFSTAHSNTIETQIVNVREFPDVARLYQVRYVPTLVFLDETGKMLDKQVGYMPLDALEKYWTNLGYDLTGKGK